MRLLYLTSNISTHDGTGTYSRGLIEAARRAGHEPAVLLPEHYKGEMPPSLAPDMWRILPSPKTMADSLIKTWLATRRIASAVSAGGKISVVHCLFERYAPLARALAGRLGAPYIISAVGSYALEGFERRPRLAGCYRAAFEGASCVAAISRFTADLVARHAPRASIEVMYPGIDPPDVPPDAAADIPREPLLLSVGALKPRKGQDVLLKAFALLAPEFPEWRFIAAGETGDPEMLEAMRGIIAANNLENRVELRGHVSHDALMDLYRRAEIFALAPRADGWRIEGYGLVFLEAAARGIPVVCTRDCGFAEHMREHAIGALAANDTPEALRDALAPLLRDESRRRERGRAAAAFALGRTWDAAFRPLAAACKKACQPR